MVEVLIPIFLRLNSSGVLAFIETFGGSSKRYYRLKLTPESILLHCRWLATFFLSNINRPHSVCFQNVFSHSRDFYQSKDIKQLLFQEKVKAYSRNVFGVRLTFFHLLPNYGIKVFYSTVKVKIIENPFTWI